MFILCSLLSDLRPDTAHQVGSLVLLSASQRHWNPILCPSQISLYPSVYRSHFPSSDLLVFISVFHSFTSFPPLSSALFTYHKPRSSFSFLFLQAWHDDNIFHKDFNNLRVLVYETFSSCCMSLFFSLHCSAAATGLLLLLFRWYIYHFAVNQWISKSKKSKTLRV